MDQSQQPIVNKVFEELRRLNLDVARRNSDMLKRDDYIYEDGLIQSIDIPDGFDLTRYNWLRRTVDVHSAQLMGRAFSLYSYYNKEDLSVFDPNDPQAKQELKMAELRNKKRKSDADARKRAVDAIIRDNGGWQPWKHGARIGSAYGTTVYKMWWDDEGKKIAYSLLESPQNYWAGWSDSNFRERDFDAYVWQISLVDANRKYGSKLAEGASFVVSGVGDPLSINDPATFTARQSERKMAAVIDFTGYLEGWCIKNGKPLECKPGDETKMSILIVGGHVVQVIGDEDLMPRYYLISNRVDPRRAWGISDITDSAMDINATYIERMSDYLTLANKTLFPLIKAKGFETSSVPKKKQREVTVAPMQADQDLEVLNMPTAFGFEYGKLLEELKENYVKVTGISRVLFDDPTINPNSNQALMTTLKGVIDIVEDKQARWEFAIESMFTDALKLAAKHIKQLNAVVNTGEDWYFYTQWPSVLRREDATFQQMWLNRFNAGTTSVDSYLEAMGVEDVSEELDRIRDNMKDPTAAAILGHQLPMQAHFTIYENMGIPPSGFNVPKVTLKGDLTPNQEGNMAQQQGWQDGPYPPSAGPQGNQGIAATENLVNEGFVTGNPYDGGTPIQAAPPQGAPGNTPVGAGSPQGAQPQLTPDQNTGQIASQPGSGAPAVSPAGAIAQNNQRRGR